MRKVHEKSIVLGIGIGMIITAIAGMIFSAGTTKELSKAEIMSKAKLYGMIEQVQVLNGDSASIDSTNLADDSNADESTTDSSTKDSSATDSSATDSSTAVNSTTESTVVNDRRANTTVATDKKQVIDSSSSSTAERNISIEIKHGYKAWQVAEVLLEKEVIESNKDFLTMMSSYKALTKINIGNYKFKKNDDLNYIVKTICKL